MRVLVVTSEWATPEHPEGGVFIARQVDWIRRAGVDVDIEPFRSARNPFNYRRVRARVRERLRDGGYDIVHAHFGQAGFAVLGLPAPLVATFHGSDLEGIIGPSGRYTARGWALRRLSRLVARHADEVIVVSSSLARHLPKRTQYTVIPMTADLEVFQPGSREDARRTLGLPLDRRLVLFAGRPGVKPKRFELAKLAVDLLAPDLRVELLTISGLPPSGVASYMQACDTLLLTSRHEGAPTMVKEALACRLPVVSVDVGDVRETVGHVAGCVISDPRPEALSRALTQVLEHPRRLDGSERAEVLDQSKQVARVVALYERVLESRPLPDGAAP
jgi:glycosyltransferase involved in cell wall biosynthesis